MKLVLDQLVRLRALMLGQQVTPSTKRRDMRPKRRRDLPSDRRDAGVAPTRHTDAVEYGAVTAQRVSESWKAPRADDTEIRSVNLVNYDGSGWILEQICQKMGSEFVRLGLYCNISTSPQPGFDVVHHVPFHAVTFPAGRLVDSMLVTHLDSDAKVARVEKAASRGIIPITMSRQTQSMVRPQAWNGQKVKPAVALLPSSIGAFPKITLGVFFRVYDDGRKRESELLRILRFVNPDEIRFHIMGSGWNSIVDELLAKGVEVVWQADFNRTLYDRWVREVDYVLLTGRDEGAVAMLDALTVGTSIIAPSIGYHLDFNSKLVNFANTARQVGKIIAPELLSRRQIYEFLGPTGWRRYSLEHLQIWSDASSRIRQRGRYK